MPNPLTETTPNRMAPTTPRASLASSSKLSRSISRSNVKLGSAMKSSKSEYNLSINRSSPRSSITKPRAHNELYSSSRKPRNSSLMPVSRSSIGISQMLQQQETSSPHRVELRVNRHVSVTPQRHRRVLDEAGDDSLLPSSPFEQYPGMASGGGELYSSPPPAPSTSQTPVRQESTPRSVSHTQARSRTQTPRAASPQSAQAETPKQQHRLHTPATSRSQYLLDLNTPAEAANVRFSPSFLSSDTTPTQQKIGRKSECGQNEMCLLDLDLPVQTPRSVPSMSSRQVESLKAGYLSEIASAKAELAGKESELAALRTALRESEERNAVMEQRCQDESDRLEKVAKELHMQYSKKHETKVLALKKQLEAKWSARLEVSDKRIAELTAELEVERSEKDELVKLCDLYLETADQMQFPAKREHQPKDGS